MRDRNSGRQPQDQVFRIFAGTGATFEAACRRAEQGMTAWLQAQTFWRKPDGTDQVEVSMAPPIGPAAPGDAWIAVTYVRAYLYEPEVVTEAVASQI